jgi:hypothetical protein
MTQFIFYHFVMFLSKGEHFAIPFSKDLILLILIIPLLTLLFIYSASFLENKKIYNLSLLSSILSFFLSLIL